jgi:ankyrin repeat protein
MATLVLVGLLSWSGVEAGPIHDAAEAGKVDVVRRLLAEGTDVDTRSETGITALQAAAIWGHSDVAEVLLSKGADPNATENGDHRKLCRLLLERGAAVDARARNGWTPLHVAAVWGHMAIAEILIAHGAQVDARAEDRSTPLRLTASTSGCHKDVPRLLGKKGADVEGKFPDGMTPLHVAALNDQRELVVLLVEHGADVNAKAGNGWTPLDVAALYGHRDLVALLGSYGARR